MLAVVAVAPLLAQAGVAYVKHLDTLLIKANPGARGLPKMSLMEIAETAVSCLDDDDKKNALEERERLHLQALQCLLDDEHQTALVSLLKVLRSCPGDLLALSLAMDLAFTVGDKASALR